MIDSVDSGHVYMTTNIYRYGFSSAHKEILLDWFSIYYKNQKIIINATDGQNIGVSGLLDFFDFLCDQLAIDKSSVIVQTHYPWKNNGFTYIECEKSIFNAGKIRLAHAVEQNQFVRKTDAKFIGTVIGSFRPHRLRLLYEIDKTFTGDTFLIFRPNMEEIYKEYNTITPDWFSEELEWVKQKKFNGNQDAPADYGWVRSYDTYHEIWGEFEIEVIAETDPRNNGFFTEKTARCLATGKPFVLIEDANSLQKLRDRGFYTFNDVLDESYDSETNPTRRIQNMLSSLTELYNSSDKKDKINRMYKIAQHNITHYFKN